MIKNVKVVSIILVVILSLSAFFTGCRAAQQPSSSSASSNAASNASSNASTIAKEPVTINVLLGANPETEIIKQNIPDFEKETGIKVKLNEVPVDTLNTKLSVEVNGGSNSTDVAGFQYEWIPKFSKDLLPINKYLTEEDKKDIIPSAIDAATYEGNQYGLLYVTTAMILYYRTDLLDAKGIKVPKTWDEYIAAAKELTSTDPEIWGTMVTAKATEEPVGMYLNYLYQNGGDIIDANNNVTINSPEAVEAMQFMVDQVNNYKVAPPGANNYWTVDTTNLFKEGKLAMAPNWSYMYSVVNADDSKVKGKVGMALLPSKKKDAVSLGGWVLTVFKNSTHPDEAYKFIHFMTDKERQKIMALKCGNTPSRNSAISDPEVAGIPLFPIMFEALKTAVPRSKYPNFDQISNQLSIALSGSVSKSMESKKALDDAAEAIKSAVAKQ